MNERNESLDVVEQHLTALELRFRRTDNDHIKLGFTAKNVAYELMITGSDPLLSVVVPDLAVIPAARVDEAIRLANLVNGGFLRNGCFWVQPQHRRVGFEMGVLTPGGSTVDHIGFALTGLNAVDRFYPAFALVLWGGATAEQALAAMLRADAEAEDGVEAEPEADTDEPGYDIAV